MQLTYEVESQSFYMVMLFKIQDVAVIKKKNHLLHIEVIFAREIFLKS